MIEVRSQLSATTTFKCTSSKQYRFLPRNAFTNCLRATLITFYRPFVSTVLQGLPLVAEESWRARVRTRMESAATQSNSILDCIAREGLVGFATPMT